MKLFCPGPVELSSSVKDAMVNCSMGHRSEDFKKFFIQLKSNVIKLCMADSSYEAIVLSSSGSSANEAVVASIFNKSDKILILSNGEFGIRFENLIEHYELEHDIYSEQWGTPFNYSNIEEQIKNNNYTYVVIAHDETSSGMINPLKELGEICKKYNVKVFADCVSSLASDHLNLVEDNISIMTSSSGKAIGAAPGASIIVIKRDILESSTDNIVSSKYLNLHTYYEYSRKYSQTPNTPNIHCFFSLNQAIIECLEIDKKKNYQLMSTFIRENLTKMGFQTIIDEKYMSNTVTTFICPKGTNCIDIYNKLYEKGYVCYLGGKLLTDKNCFQVAVMGNINMNDCIEFVNEVKKIIDKI